LTAASPPANCAAAQQKQLYWYSSYGGIEVREQVFTQAKRGLFIKSLSEKSWKRVGAHYHNPLFICVAFGKPLRVYICVA
jgi:hypothetical protein